MEGIFLLAAGMEWEQTLAFLFHESVCTSKAKLVHASALGKGSCTASATPHHVTCNLNFFLFRLHYIRTSFNSPTAASFPLPAPFTITSARCKLTGCFS